jgi:PAS domain S-box-containing protein
METSPEAVFQSDATLHSGLILAIDDDAVSLEILRELLELEGYRVLTATDGGRGLEIFMEERPQLVITDIRMPNLDGLELLQRLNDVDDSVPVILVTGFGDLDNAIKALRDGAFDFLQKPINTEILIKIVRQGLERCHLRRFALHHTRVLQQTVDARTMELAQANKELGEANKFLKGILDSSTGVSIVLTDFGQKVLFWNSGAENIFGYSKDEMVGDTITKIYVKEQAASGIVDRLRKMIQAKEGTVHGKMEQLSKDGRRLTISMALSPMLDASGEVKGILGLGQDVTEEVRLHKELLNSYGRIKRLQQSSMFALAKLAESRDGETGNHLRRIEKYCAVLCQYLRHTEKFKDVLTENYIEYLVQSSILHDIGKVAIPDEILFFPGEFNVDHKEIMKQHTIFGGKALEEAAEETGDESFLSLGKDIAYYHHERWDGTGYPIQLQGEEIPLPARIVAVADVYDALTTKRRYKRAYTHDEAYAMLIKERGKQFDPDVIDAFIAVRREFQEIREGIGQDPEPFGGPREVQQITQPAAHSA